MVAIVLSAIFVICAGIIIIIPQIWLVKNATLFLVYWTLMILSAIDKRAVCSQCEKCFCPLNKKFKNRSVIVPQGPWQLRIRQALGRKNEGASE